MRKYQYAVAIVVGLVVGAIVALKIGNYLTAVLSGVIATSLTTWIVSLNWSQEQARALGRAVSQKMDSCFKEIREIPVSWINLIREEETWWGKIFFVLLPVTIPLGILFILAVAALIVVVALVAVALIITCLVFTGLYFLVIKPAWRIPYLIWTQPKIRKGVYYNLALLGLLVFIGLQAIRLFLLSSGDFSFLDVFLSVIFMVCLLGSIWGWGFFLLFCWRLYVVGISKPEDFEFSEMEGERDWWSDWFESGMDDGRPPLESVLYMLAIRTFNAVSPAIWLIIFIFWTPIALASKKTGLSSLTAAILSASHLGISYWCNWINVTNTNFWLSLLIAMMFGAWLGCKIYYLKSIKAPALPKLHFLKHLSTIGR